MSLYHKYRPISLSAIVGNEDMVLTLSNELEREDPPHAYLLHGPTGCGKTTLARIIATKLGCVGADLTEVDSADFRGIDTIRDIRKQTGFMPLEGDARVWILDECHQMTSIAQSALLKALEDTPPHVYFILCTTNPEKLLPTIRGRCSQHKVTTLEEKVLYNLLRRVVKAERETLEKKVYRQIMMDSGGHPRNALQILDQVLSAPKEKRLGVAKQVAEQQNAAIELCRALISTSSSWKKVAGILKGLKKDEAENIRRNVLGYASAVLLNGRDSDRLGILIDVMSEPTYNGGFPQLVGMCYTVIRS